MTPATPRLLLTLSACTLLLSGRLHAQDDQRLRSDVAWRGIGQPTTVVRQIQDIGSQLMQQRAAGSRRGTRLLFSGPDGTGKTMAARLLAGHLGKAVYRVDLSSVVSKYVGETEKNLSRVFSAAESTDVILLLDEGDALFGTRTNVKDAHDKYADQEVSYLLQRIEAYPGLIIITSNSSGFPSKLRLDYRVEFAPTAKPHRPPGTR